MRTIEMVRALLIRTAAFGVRLYFNFHGMQVPDAVNQLIAKWG